ncbi:hypothetical protein QBC38DRAFT_342924, partial [Podospora fimiseda]
YLTPEQFSAEWDWIKLLPDDSTTQSHKTAGQFGACTNIYQVACTMCSLITLYKPQRPPV